MSRPKSVFVTGLRRFARLVAFANVTADRTVPFHTASLRRRNLYSLGADGFDLRARLRDFPHIVASPDSLTLLQLQKHAFQSTAGYGSEGQVALLEHESGGGWLELGARLSIMTILLPVWLVVAPTVTAVIVHRKNAANVGKLKYCLPAAEAGTADWDTAAVGVSVIQRATSTNGGTDALQLPAAVVASARDIKSEMLQGIGSLPWLRVDVSLPGAHTHGRIVVRRPWIDSGGQDVVKFLVEVALVR
jgi:hypothetical protein